jgi:hypothetical protein
MITSRMLKLLAGCWAVLVSISAHAQAPHEGRLTFVDGEVRVLRGANKLAAPVGLALKPGDIIEVHKASRLVRVELADDTVVDLGPGALVLFQPQLAGHRSRRPSDAYVLAGWAKATASAGRDALVMTPLMEVATKGVALVHVAASGEHAFAEQGGTSIWKRNGQDSRSATLSLGSGELVYAQRGSELIRAADRALASWATGVPLSLRDSLPRRREQINIVSPDTGRPLTPDDVKPWLEAEPALRSALQAQWALLSGRPVASVAPPPRASVRAPQQTASPPHPRAARANASPEPQQALTNTAKVAGQPRAASAVSTPSAASQPDRALLQSLELATFSSAERSAQGGAISPVASADRAGDASVGSISAKAGVLHVTGRFSDTGRSAWGSVGISIAVSPRLDASGYESLRLQLAAAPGVRTLRVRIVGSDSTLRSSGCYPIFDVPVTPQSKTYDIAFSRFAPDLFCGGAGASAAETLRQLVAVEVTDAVRPVVPRAVDFSVGPVGLVR